MNDSRLVNIDVLQAFDAMRVFIERYWERGGKKSDDLAVLLGLIDLDPDKREDPLDSAQWTDWLAACESVICKSK